MTRPDELAVAVDGIVVLRPLGVLQLRHALRNARYLARRNGTELSPVLEALLVAVEHVEVPPDPAPRAPVREAVPHVDGAGSSPGPSDQPGDRLVLSSVDVARLAGVTRRAVSKAAQRGRLVGHLDRGSWTFSEAAVQTWMARRNL